MKKLMMPAVALSAMAAARPSGVIGSPRAEADAGSVDALLKDVKSQLERIGSDVKRTAEQALAESKKSGDLSAETKAAADQQLSKWHEMSGKVENLTGKLEALETRNLDLEQQVAGGRSGSDAPASIGYEVANSDALKAYRGSGQQSVTIRPSAAITSVDGSAGGLIWEQRETDPVNMPRQALPLRALLNVVTTDSSLIVYPRQVLRQNNAAPTAEGAPLPESAYGWEKAEAPVRKIGHHTNVSDEALADSGQLQGLIDGELRYGLRLEEEQQILAGDGNSDNLLGMITQATDFTPAAGLPNETRIDRLRLGLLQVALTNYAANGVTLHPVDWAGIDLTKDSQNRYIFGNPNTVSTPRLWGLDVIPTMSHSVGEWMCGNFFMAATLYDRQEVEILISSEHGTNFVDGMKTMKATERLALAIKRRAALVTGDFTFP